MKKDWLDFYDDIERILTKRELEIVQFCFIGKHRPSVKDIAVTYKISIKTVHVHCHKINLKLKTIGLGWYDNDIYLPLRHLEKITSTTPAPDSTK